MAGFHHWIAEMLGKGDSFLSKFYEARYASRMDGSVWLHSLKNHLLSSSYSMQGHSLYYHKALIWNNTQPSMASDILASWNYGQFRKEWPWEGNSLFSLHILKMMRWLSIFGSCYDEFKQKFYHIKICTCIYLLSIKHCCFWVMVIHLILNETFMCSAHVWSCVSWIPLFTSEKGEGGRTKALGK